MRWPAELFFAFISFLLGSGMQVSGYTNAYLAAFFFVLAATLAAHWAWPHARAAWNEVRFYRPRRPWKRICTHKVVAKTPPVVSAAENAMTDEQRHFRLGLRQLVTRLATAYRAQRVVIDRVAQARPGHSELGWLATHSVGLMRPNIGELESMAQVDIAKMEQGKLQEMVVAFLRHNYGESQSVLRRLREGLVRYGADPSPDDLKNHMGILKWLEADEDCLRTFRDVNTSPEAAAGLRSGREKYFGTIDPNRWGGPSL